MQGTMCKLTGRIEAHFANCWFALPGTDCLERLSVGLGELPLAEVDIDIGVDIEVGVGVEGELESDSGYLSKVLPFEQSVHPAVVGTLGPTVKQCWPEHSSAHQDKSVQE